MDTNSRIIRDERDDTSVFDKASRPTPRIDLILGVALAVVAGAVGVLSSLGLGAAGAPTELMRPSAQVALAEPEPFEPESVDTATLDPVPLEMAPIVVAAPDADFEKIFLFEAADAPAIAAAPEEDATRARVERALACLDEMRRDAEDDGKVDHRSVIRFLGAATRAAMDDAEFDTTIDEVTITIESLIDQMETPRMTAPARTAPSPDRRARTLRLPVRTVGL
jgi:hypothetical protein